MKKRHHHILIVDDDNRIRELLKKFLMDHGYVISIAADTKEARKIISSFTIDLIILDIMMPKETGIEFAKILRQTSSVAILMLTAMGDVEQRITGLISGADDYMAKPFEPRELLIRIQKLIHNRKNLTITSDKNTIFFDQIKYNISTNILSNSNENISISSGESKLLNILIGHLGSAISREKLAKLCGNINERSVDVQITRLRNKIEADPKRPRFIQTLRGKGYALFGNRLNEEQ